MHGIGLIERAAVDADAQIRSDRMAKPGLYPQQHQPHGARNKRRYGENGSERQQELSGFAESKEVDQRLREPMLEDPFRLSEYTQEWQHSANARYFSERCGDRHQKQRSELYTAPREDVVPQTAQERQGSLLARVVSHGINLREAHATLQYL